MVEDNLLVSKTISDALVMKTWRLSQECLLTFGLMYREAVVNFLETGNNTDNFIKYSVAIINNTNKFIVVFKVNVEYENLQYFSTLYLFHAGDQQQMDCTGDSV